LIANDKTNSDVAIVSIVGPRKVGKSFLVDCLVSYEEKAVNREMTRNSKLLINMPTKAFTGRNG
jgi:predicted AAA+ superfamily ATPase